jgi:preprotein translocase subunit Sec61beta
MQAQPTFFNREEDKKMADKNRVSMPASTAGLTRYFEDYKSNLSIKPAYVLVLAFIIILILLLLNAYGKALLG